MADITTESRKRGPNLDEVLAELMEDTLAKEYGWSNQAQKAAALGIPNQRTYSDRLAAKRFDLRHLAHLAIELRLSVSELLGKHPRMQSEEATDPATSSLDRGFDVLRGILTADQQRRLVDVFREQSRAGSPEQALQLLEAATGMILAAASRASRGDAT